MNTFLDLIRNNKNSFAGICIIVFIILWTAAYAHGINASGRVIALFGLVILISIAMYAWIVNDVMHNDKKVMRYFTVALIGLGCAYGFIMYPGSIPDETVHFAVSYMYANCILLTPQDPYDIYITARGDDAYFMCHLMQQLMSKQSNDIFNNNFSFFCNDLSFTSFACADLGQPITNLTQAKIFGTFPVQTKIVSALGIVISRIMALGSFPLFYIGRLFNLAVFVVMVVAAVRLTPVGRNIFMGVALLPVTLSMAASYSYDSFIIGISILLTSLMLRAIYGERVVQRNMQGADSIKNEKMSRKLKVAILICVALLAPCKTIYSMLLFMGFLIPVSRFDNKKSSHMFKCALVLVAIAFILITHAIDALPAILNPNMPTMTIDRQSVEQPTYYSISDIILHPYNTFLVFTQTIDNTDFEFWVRSILGGSLGYYHYETTVFGPYIYMMVILLAICVIKTPFEKFDIPARHRVVFALISIITIFLVMLAMFLSWTQTTEKVINGVQGRYFLPIFALFLLSIRSKQIVAKSDRQHWVILAYTSINLTLLMFIYAKTLSFV